MTKEYMEEYRQLKKRVSALMDLHSSLLAGAYARTPKDVDPKRDTPGNLAVERAGVGDLVASLSATIQKMQTEVDRFMETIDDPLVRALVSLRYESTLTWNETAEKLGNGSSEATRMIWVRYCESHGIE